MPTSIQGVAYSPFRDCQNPNWGPAPTTSQMIEDLTWLRHMGNAIRTYSSTGIQAEIPVAASRVGLRVSAGAWLGKDKKRNEEEIAGLIALTKKTHLESVIVGNEVLLRQDLSEDELLAYIQRVKAAVGDVPVTTAEISGILMQHPRLMQAVDYELVHLYAYWDGIPIENAARYVVDQYHQIQQQADGKRVVIGETGWPEAGPLQGWAVPSLENERRFLREFLTLAQRENVEFYYFATENELWKTEGGVGPYWGVLYSDRSNKYDLQSVLVPVNDTLHPTANISPLPSATPGPKKVTAPIFPIYTDYAVPANHFAPAGWMGDIKAIHFTDCASLGQEWASRVIKVQYTPDTKDKEGWAGIYWLEPEDNWATRPGGYDLRGFSQLRFHVRSTTEGAQVKFLVGGVTSGSYPSSITTPIYAQGADPQGFVTLSQAWQELHIDLRGADLSHVIDGFAWVTERARTPKGVAFYLDDIAFDHQPPPVPPTSPPRPSPTPRLMPTPTARPTSGQLPIYVGSTLSSGYDMGVDTSEGQHDWVTDQPGAMKLNYPAAQSWGAVFITVGHPVPPGQRQSRDFSRYQTLAIDLKGAQGGERLSIGIKDRDDPDDGSETKIPVTLATEWQTCRFPLTRFISANLTQLYVPAEFVFEPEASAEIVYFRNVRYLIEPVTDITCRK